MTLFRQGDVMGSLEAFDAALLTDPGIRPYLWQRGLSLYYLEQCVALCAAECLGAAESCAQTSQQLTNSTIKCIPSQKGSRYQLCAPKLPAR